MTFEDFESFLPRLPIQPPPELFDWMREQGDLGTNALIYRTEYVKNEIDGRSEKVMECTCSACGGSFYAGHRVEESGCYRGGGRRYGFIHANLGKIWHRDTTYCPICMAPVTALHAGMVQDTTCLEYHVRATVHAIEGHLCLLSWRIRKYCNKSAETWETASPYEAYVEDGKKMHKAVGWQQYMGSEVEFGRWEARKKYLDTLMGCEVMPFDPAILEQTGVPNCKLDIFAKLQKPWVATYLRLYQKHNNVENLIMQGAGDFVNRVIEGNSKQISQGYNAKWIGHADLPGVDYKAKRPCDMLGLNKNEFRVLTKDEWGKSEWEFYRTAKNNGVRAEDVKKLAPWGLREAKEFLEKGWNPVQAIRYLEKQKAKYPNTAGHMELSHLRDYWEMCIKRKDDLKDHALRWPQNLYSAHDQAAERVNALGDDALREQFTQRNENLTAFAWEEGDILIRPAKAQAELRKEGKQLHHCVASYAEKHASGKTAIFFIRKTEAPDVPWFTLEWDEKENRVRQNRGERNCAPPDEVNFFVAKWLKHNEKIKKEQKQHGTANKSNESTESPAA